MTSFACRLCRIHKTNPFFFMTVVVLYNVLKSPKKCLICNDAKIFKKCVNKHKQLASLAMLQNETFSRYFQTLCCTFSSSKKIFCKVFFGSCQGSSKAYGNRSEKNISRKGSGARGKLKMKRKWPFFLQRNMTVGSSSSVLIVLSLQFSTKRELKRESYTSGTTALRIQLNCCLMHNQTTKKSREIDFEKSSQKRSSQE